MKTSTLERPTRTKQNRIVRAIGHVLRKLLTVAAIFGALYASFLGPISIVTDAGIEGPLWWFLVIPSIMIAIAIVIRIGFFIEKLWEARYGKIQKDE